MVWICEPDANSIVEFLQISLPKEDMQLLTFVGYQYADKPFVIPAKAGIQSFYQFIIQIYIRIHICN
ncbi:hypothetical protein ACFL6S_32805, partial [Candidatus Poribacteria bacterium]